MEDKSIEKFIEHQEEPLDFTSDEFESKIEALLELSKAPCKILLLLLIGMIDQVKNAPHDRKYYMTSKGVKKTDYNIYIGIGGNIYIYYRLYKYALRIEDDVKAQDYLNKAYEAFKICRDIVRKYQEKEQGKNDKVPSFFLGFAGIETLGALIINDLQGCDSDEFNECIEEILTYKEDTSAALTNFGIVNEILYGRAGYLYCLLLLRQKFPKNLTEHLDPLIVATVELLLEEGTKDEYDYLHYTFPRVGHQYVGAAHGTTGILYMLLKSVDVMPELLDNSSVCEKIKKTLSMLMIQQSKTGNFPYLVDDILTEQNEPTHWCHGSPGAIPVFMEAYKLFKNKDYLETAIKAAECVWKRGLIKKGFGLCHGICGNAYMLMTMYLYTGEELWKKRAQSFLLWTGDQDIINIVENNKLGGFQVTGVPDTPYSLMEGQGGQIVAYADFLGWNKTDYSNLDIKFPGHTL